MPAAELSCDEVVNSPDWTFERGSLKSSSAPLVHLKLLYTKAKTSELISVKWKKETM